MDIGLALPQYDYAVPGDAPLTWDSVVSCATRAEALGFGSVWLADHLFLSVEKYGGPPSPSFGYDPLVALAALARRTTTVRLGTLVICAQLRPPTVLAKALSTLDRVATGRVIVGMGAGWYEPEFAAAGVPFERPGVRLQQLGEAVEMLRGMFGGGPFAYEGRHWSADDARCLPTPVQQPAPPIWIGGKGDRLLDVVAAHADGWNTVWAWTPAEYKQRIAVLDAACERIGRDPATVMRSLGLYTLVGEDRTDLARRFEHLRAVTPPGVLDGVDVDGWRTGHLVGTPDEVAEQLAGWAELGVSSFVVGAGAVPFAVTGDDDIEMIAAACRLGRQ